MNNNLQKKVLKSYEDIFHIEKNGLNFSSDSKKFIIRYDYPNTDPEYKHKVVLFQGEEYYTASNVYYKNNMCITLEVSYEAVTVDIQQVYILDENNNFVLTYDYRKDVEYISLMPKLKTGMFVENNDGFLGIVAGSYIIYEGGNLTMISDEFSNINTIWSEKTECFANCTPTDSHMLWSCKYDN